MKLKPIVVFDFETTGLDPNVNDPCQIACLVIDPYKLSIVPGSEFCSDMNVLPENEGNIQDKALEVNKFTRERIAKAPAQKVVWENFANHVGKWNPKAKSEFLAPIGAGKNSRDFDMGYVRTLCTRYGMVDSRGRQYLFSNRDHIDLEDIIRLWFWGSQEITDLKMDTLRDYFGMSKENAHDALQDCRDTAQVITRFLKFHQAIGKYGAKFKGAFGEAA